MVNILTILQVENSDLVKEGGQLASVPLGLCQSRCLSPVPTPAQGSFIPSLLYSISDWGCG